MQYTSYSRDRARVRFKDILINTLLYVGFLAAMVLAYRCGIVQ
jgi:hypothetical protein